MADLDLIKEQLAAINDERAALEEKRREALAEFGELALPALRENAEFAAPVEKIDGIEAEAGLLDEKEASLLAEQEQLEQEERERIAKLTCFSCKAVSPDGAKFCENCGAKLGEPPREYCMDCGTMNPPEMKFCGGCGRKLDE